MKTTQVALEPLLVNLADTGDPAYLRIALTLQIEQPQPVKGEKAKEETPAKGAPARNENEALMRDTALEVLGRATSEALLAADGKEHLKAQLRQAFARQVPEVKVVGVMFTEFLVQR